MAAFFSLQLSLLYNDLSSVERDPGGGYFSSVVDCWDCSLVNCKFGDISSDALLGLLISGLLICGFNCGLLISGVLGGPSAGEDAGGPTSDLHTAYLAMSWHITISFLIGGAMEFRIRL